MDESIKLGGTSAFNGLIFQSGFAKAAVQKHKDEYMVQLHAEQNSTVGACMGKLAAKAAVMTPSTSSETRTRRLKNQQPTEQS